MTRNELIIQLHVAGYSYKQIAEQVGISPSRVGQIVKAWKFQQLIEAMKQSQ